MGQKTDIETLEDKMEKRFAEMEDKIESIDKKLDKVVSAILGNELTKEGGIVNKIKELEEHQSVLETYIETIQTQQKTHDDFRKRVIWTVGTSLFILGGIWAILKLLIENKLI